MKMMILKHGRIQNEKYMNNINKFHYFPSNLKETKTKKQKNSKSRTRYAEYNQNDETIV